ncbi:hypothetical protein GCK72_022075 [Caenorhabditis remanei]|uniref:Uncharacterized protein n=1 Tax=Caenorhabditis remanei TaxID=31234 RepID=A0A6A5FSS0_CAERE|nr:hypothetical protein GCK72_022075 [Caenorhabditis remanei]KAF1745628.1 hypothetical protein GCK72_022075 [Caenorhabditis remanei]
MASKTFTNLLLWHIMNLRSEHIRPKLLVTGDELSQHTNVLKIDIGIRVERLHRNIFLRLRSVFERPQMGFPRVRQAESFLFRLAAPHDFQIIEAVIQSELLQITIDPRSGRFWTENVDFWRESGFPGRQQGNTIPGPVGRHLVFKEKTDSHQEFDSRENLWEPVYQDNQDSRDIQREGTSRISSNPRREVNAKTGWATRKISSRPKQAVGGYSLLYIDGN